MNTHNNEKIAASKSNQNTMSSHNRKKSVQSNQASDRHCALKQDGKI
ncbi:hypothetical protein ME3_01156 [Bartonella melophagi K-2C]|uniref:Uncharacterized protein n=1 Tax=Bartonella melophagi K-2C TaxID=1094557 RepID=J1JUH1_9HYPH|nr:hypothetical protein ME3_01156 [Bartonella melophagi K-2C]